MTENGMMTEHDARELLSTVFGDDWEMTLAAEGIVGGDEDSAILVDQARVVEKARAAGVSDETAQAVGSAWFLLWSIDPSAPPGWR